MIAFLFFKYATIIWCWFEYHFLERDDWNRWFFEVRIQLLWATSFEDQWAYILENALKSVTIIISEFKVIFSLLGHSVSIFEKRRLFLKLYCETHTLRQQHLPSAPGNRTSTLCPWEEKVGGLVWRWGWNSLFIETSQCRSEF